MIKHAGISFDYQIIVVECSKKRGGRDRISPKHWYTSEMKVSHLSVSGIDWSLLVCIYLEVITVSTANYAHLFRNCILWCEQNHLTYMHHSFYSPVWFQSNNVFLYLTTTAPHARTLSRNRLHWMLLVCGREFVVASSVCFRTNPLPISL